MQLDLTPLQKAIAQLDIALAYANSDQARADANAAQVFRTAAIQTFEFTYELSWKMLKRYLEISSGSPETIEQMAFADLIRTGNEQALLLSDWPAWKGFRESRSITSHTYDEEKAAKVFATIPRFREEAAFLLQRLEERTPTA